jgi:hypothetical protein
MRNSNFVLTQTENDSMIGVILNIENSEYGKEIFKKRCIAGLQSHFDVEISDVQEIPDLFDGWLTHSIIVDIDEVSYKITIETTWVL